LLKLNLGEYFMGWYNESWSHRKKLTINYNKFPSTQTNFPVRVSLDNANFDFSKALSTGADIRFTSDDGETLLDFDREVHDSVNEIAEYFVKFSSISGYTDLTSPGEASTKAFADSDDGSHPAQNAFNGGRWQSANTAFPHYIGWDFGAGNAQTINAYTLQNRDADAGWEQAPYDWKLQGSQTGAWSGEEVDLDIRVNEVFVRKQKRVFENFSEGENTTAYRYYRIYITDNQPEATDNTVSLIDIEFITGTDTDFYIYYGNISASDDVDSESVWSNYDAVWHLKEQTDGTSGEIVDSTSSNHDGTGSGFPTSVDGIIYKGQQGGTNKYISIPDSSDWDFDSGNFKIEFKFRYSVSLGTVVFMGHSDGVNKWLLGYELTTPGNNKIEFHSEPGGTAVQFKLFNTWELSPDTDYHCVIQRNGLQWDCFLNGARVDFEFPGAVTVGNASNPLTLLTDGDGSNWFDAILDEVRIKKGSYSSEHYYFSLYYTDSNDLLSFGEEEGYSETLYIYEDAIIRNTGNLELIYDTDLRTLLSQSKIYNTELYTLRRLSNIYSTDLRSKADSRIIFYTDLRINL